MCVSAIGGNVRGTKVRAVNPTTKLISFVTRESFGKLSVPAAAVIPKKLALVFMTGRKGCVGPL